MVSWNPWHGCHKYSEGCANCYVYRGDARYGRDSTVVYKTADYDLPVRRGRDGRYSLKPASDVYTCFSSDFFVEDADEWRPQAWDMMRRRDDLTFLFITKRILRLAECLPGDWGTGWAHINLCVTMENQCAVDERMPVYLEAPQKKRMIICEPLLGPVDFGGQLGPWINRVVAGGESGPDARECRYEWVESLRRQCDEKGVGFYFKQTGANFVRDGKRYRIPRRYQHLQARKAGISTTGLMDRDERT